VIVVDASAIIESLLRTPDAEAIDQRLFGSGRTLHAPHLLDIEVAQTIRRYVAAGAIAANRGAEAVADLADFPLRRHAHDMLLPRVWALRNNFSAYDGAYVALAEALDAALLTCDDRLASAVKDHAAMELA
jgi:predicted nucleic acid-binding protein